MIEAETAVIAAKRPAAFLLETTCMVSEWMRIE
jgi:hypothetical protein